MPFSETCATSSLGAFKATLEELVDASLLLHVVDLSNPRFEEQIRSVDRILHDLELHGIPRLLVFNKIDLIDGAQPRIDHDESGRPTAVWLSAERGDGCELLQQVLDEWFASESIRRRICLPNRSAGNFYRWCRAAS